MVLNTMIFRSIGEGFISAWCRKLKRLIFKGESTLETSVSMKECSHHFKGGEA